MVVEWLKNLVITFVVSVIVIILAVIYFGITLWIIRVASNVFFGTGLEANWAVFSATIMATGAVLAGALEKKPSKK